MAGEDSTELEVTGIDGSKELASAESLEEYLERQKGKILSPEAKSTEEGVLRLMDIGYLT